MEADVKKFLLQTGHLPEDLAQIEAVAEKTNFSTGGRKISKVEAIKILGVNGFWSAMGQSAFHRTTTRTAPDGKEVSFNSYPFFK